MNEALQIAQGSSTTKEVLNSLLLLEQSRLALSHGEFENAARLLRDARATDDAELGKCDVRPDIDELQAKLYVEMGALVKADSVYEVLIGEEENCIGDCPRLARLISARSDILLALGDTVSAKVFQKQAQSMMDRSDSIE